MNKLIEIKAPFYLGVDVNYSLGGQNWFYGNSFSRGYYLSITPVEKGDMSTSTIIGDGYRKNILECTKRTEKRNAEAIRVSISSDYLGMIVRKIFSDKRGHAEHRMHEPRDENEKQAYIAGDIEKALASVKEVLENMLSEEVKKCEK